MLQVYIGFLLGMLAGGLLASIFTFITFSVFHKRIQKAITMDMNALKEKINNLKGE